MEMDYYKKELIKCFKKELNNIYFKYNEVATPYINLKLENISFETFTPVESKLLDEQSKLLGWISCNPSK